MGEPEELETPGGAAEDAVSEPCDGKGLVVRETAEDETGPSSLLPYPVAALGASAGGLEAYIDIFKSLPPNVRMSFIVIPHLSAEHESHLAEILSRNTAMPVQEIEHGMRPEPAHVYVLPPAKLATISNGRLMLEPRPPDVRGPLTIDRFFRSLAADQKNRAIGVLLSGNDSDGSLGLGSIKGEGGISIVQDPDTAQFGGMPRSGILSDHVDLILTPEAIAHELARLADDIPRLESRSAGIVEPSEAEDAHFARILMMLRPLFGVDFRYYRQATLRRRMVRRMMLRRIASLRDYAVYLQANRDELRSLHNDLLISVTRFFRDPEVFDKLRVDIFPRMFEHRPPDQQVRVWVAGCSTGEEAYSIAICLLEYFAQNPVEPPIQIFGTDASERSIERARAATYPENIAAEVSPERLRRYFVKVDGSYQLSKRVRDLCIFARQNLCYDPPFSRLDLVACRNVLIYLGEDMQQRIVDTFHYALRPSGHLLLGGAESIREHVELFTAIDRKNKIYAKIATAGQVIPDPIPRLSAKDMNPYPLTAGPRDALSEPELQKAADRIVLARYGPAGVVINERMEVLQVRGRTAPYLNIAQASASPDLLRMARDGLGPALRNAVRRSIEEDVPVAVENLTLHEGDQDYSFKLEVLPIAGIGGRPRTYLVTFVPAAKPAAPALTEPLPGSPPEGTPDDLKRELVMLQQDLASTRLYLQSLVEERDARNQELTSAYEELQSANEELQSTNEELETAKEELQSTNEELQTVNEELRNRNTALTQASNDFSNLLTSVNIPVVMLGSDLTIRQYTPPAERLMRIRRTDIGRPIAEIRLNLVIDELESVLQEVLETLATRELNVQDRDGKWHLLRIRPYRTSDNKIDGLVMLLLDIDQLRHSEEAMRQARDFSLAVVESVQVPLVVLDGSLRVRLANRAFRSLSSMHMDDLNLRSFPELANLLWSFSDLRAQLGMMGDKVDPVRSFEVEHSVPGGPLRMLRLNGHPVEFNDEPWVLLTVEDITAQRTAEVILENERQRLSGEVHQKAEALDRSQNELRALAARLFTSQEEECRRVARELHDDISQRLAGLELDAERLRQTLPGNPEEAAQQVESIRTGMGELSREVRSISHGLHPTILDDLGLSHALKRLVEDFGAREEMPVTFTRRRVPEKISPDVGAALYRITQEALRNISKHAGKTHVKVRLEGVRDGVRLTVSDSGEGFDQAARRGLGLISMQERAALVNGTCSIESELGEGTTVTVTVPVPKAGEADEQTNGGIG